MKQILIRVTDTQKAKLEKTRKLDGTSISATIRTAIKNYYGKDQTDILDHGE